MRFVSLFSGIEAASVAWEPLGWTPVAFAEIDPFAGAVLAHHWPNVPNHGDVTAFDWSRYRGRCDVVIGGSPCFAAGTLVLTLDGLKPIAEVRVGDQVLTHRHRYRRVLRTGSKVAPVAWITGQGNPGTVVTAEHPYWAMPMRMEYQNKKTGFKRVFGEPEWIPARSMVGNFWSMPATHPESSMPSIVPEGNERMDWTVNEHFFWLLGAYLGDGWTRFQGNRRAQVIIGDGKHHGRQIADVAGRCGLHCSVTEERTTLRFTFNSKALARWVRRHFGHGSDGKSVPAWIYGMEPSLRRALFAGYQWADGHEADGVIKTTSVGRRLSLGMRLLGASLGLHISTVAHNPRRRECVIEGRVVREKPLFTNSYNLASRSAFFRDGNLWMKVKRYEPLGIDAQVFNLEVEEDNSYTADGFFVHNCQSYSIAGLRKSLDDPRGQLVFAFTRACDAIDPPFVCFENVPGILSGAGSPFGHFLAGLVGEPKPFASGLERGRWPDAGMVIGPKRAACWTILNAAEFGVPQRRRRLFCLAVALSHPSLPAGAAVNPAAVLLEFAGRGGRPPAGGKAGKKARRPARSRPPRGGGLFPGLFPDDVNDAVEDTPATGDGHGDSLLPPVSGTLGGGGGARGYPNSPDSCGIFVPNVSPTINGAAEGAREGWPPSVAPTLDADYHRTRGLNNRHIDGGAGWFVPGDRAGDEVRGDVASAVTAKWSKGCGGRAGDEGQNLVPVEIGPGGGKAVDVSPTLDTRAKDGPMRNQIGMAVVCPDEPYAVRLAQTSANGGGVERGVAHTVDAGGPEAVVYPLLEVGKRGGPSNDKARSCAGIGDGGDPMYTLQADAKHGVVQAMAFSVKDSGDDAGEVAPTLRAMGHDASHANGGGQLAVAIGYGGPAEIAPPLRANPGGTLRPEAAGQIAIVRDVVTMEGEVTHALRAEGADASEDGTGRGTPLVAVTEGEAPACSSLALRGREGGLSAETLPGDAAHALRAAQGTLVKPHVLPPNVVRRLTVTECERLQGLPRTGIPSSLMAATAASKTSTKCRPTGM